MLDWIPTLAVRPDEVATALRLPRRGVPAYVAQVPGTDGFVSYTVNEQYMVVLILDATSHRLDEPPAF